MPRYKFLEDNQKLNKDNFKVKLNELKNVATRDAIVTESSTDNFFSKIDIKIDYEKFDLFIERTKEKLTDDQARDFVHDCGITDNTIRERSLKKWYNVLYFRAQKTDEVNNLMDLLDNEEENRNIPLDELKERVKSHLPDEDKPNISTDYKEFITNNEIIRNFDSYLNSVDSILNEAEIEELGNVINNHKSIFEYSPNDDITNPIYNNQTNEIINTLKETKKLNGNDLTKEEIKEYETCLNSANKLFGEPIVDISPILDEKNILDNAITEDNKRGLDDKYKEMGFDHSVMYYEKVNKYGNYLVSKYNKEATVNKMKNEAEMNFSNETKKGLKEILHKMHEYGFDKNGMTGEEAEKVYGLKSLYLAGYKYKNAITNNDPNERLKAAIYAKEIVDADKKIKEIFNLIDKYLPVDKNNLAFPGNVDSIRTGGIPASYRLDYVRSSDLAALNNISNMIEAKGWDIDEFVEKPMSFIRDYYENDYFNKIDPIKANENLTGVDLFFNLSRASLGRVVDSTFYGGTRIVEGMINFEKDRNKRLENVAVHQAFEETISNPYSHLKGHREYYANYPYLDSIIINPNLTINDLDIPVYDAKALKIREKKESFDEIKYLKENKESLSNFKERLDESILKYLKKESEIFRETNSRTSLFNGANEYVTKAQTAVMKLLTVRRHEKNDPNYQALESFLRNKREYVTGLINRIPTEEKYLEYSVVKELNDNPINVEGKVYRINSIGNKNDYANFGTEFDNFIVSEKQRINRELDGFLRLEKTTNTNLKNLYKNYTKAEASYQKEIRRIYGANYNGNVDNNHSKKISDAFIKRNDLLRKYNEAKSKNIEYLKEEVRKGRLPIFYYEDRINQLDNNDFKKLPKLFRSDINITRDNYIMQKYPNDYRNLTAEEKDVLFDSYKRTNTSNEIDYFSRKFIESKDITINRKEIVGLDEVKKIDEVNIDLKPIETKFLDLENEYNEEIEIDERFDDIENLLKKNTTIDNFKDNLDKKILEYINQYDEARLNIEEFNRLPKFENIVDIAQKAAMKYMIVVGDYEKDTDTYKSLMNFVSDGNGYIDKLIIDNNNKENNNQINIRMNDFNIKDNDINKYANVFKEYNDYYNSNMNKKSLPNDVALYEGNINRELSDTKAVLDYFEKRDIRNQDRLDANERLAMIMGLGEENFKVGDYEFEIGKLSKRLEDKKIEVKNKLYDFYNNGKISKEYLEERYRRIDRNNFNLPPMFKYDKLPSADNYVRRRHPNTFNTLSNEEKKFIFDSYKNECKENKRQFIVRNFLLNKKLIDKVDLESEVYDRFKQAEEFKLNEKLIKIQGEINNLENDIKLEVGDKDLENEEPIFNLGIENEIDGIKKIEDPEDLVELDIINETNSKEVTNENHIDVFVKFSESLRDILKIELPHEEYDNDNIEEVYKYIPSKDRLFENWFNNRLEDLDDRFGDEVPTILSKAVENLDGRWKDDFIKTIKEFPEYKNYFKDFIKEYSETPLFDNALKISKKNTVRIIEDNFFEDVFKKKLKDDVKERLIDIEEDELDTTNKLIIDINKDKEIIK